MSEDDFLPLDCKIFDLSQTRKGAKARSANEPNWNGFMKELLAEKPGDRVVNKIYFEPHEVGDNFVLGVYKPVSTRFMARLNEDGSAVDLDMENLGPFRLAHASCVLFSNSTSSIGILKGHRQAPGASEIQSLLRDRTTLDGGWKWTVSPVVKAAQIDDLRKAKSVFAFRTKLVPTPETLLSSVREGNSHLSTLSRSVKNTVGAEVDIDVGIKVAKGFRTPEVGARMKSYVLSDIDETVGISKVGSAEILSHDDILETVNLARHNLALPVEITQHEGESVRFSQLVNALESNRAKIEEEGRPYLIKPTAM